MQYVARTAGLAVELALPLSRMHEIFQAVVAARFSAEAVAAPDRG
jgi:hypothetical protein